MKRLIIVSVCLLAIVLGWYGKVKYDDLHASEIKYIGMKGYHGDWYDSRSHDSLILTFGDYDGMDNWSVHLKKGKEFIIKYEVTVTEGALRFEMKGKENKLLEFSGNKNGSISVHTKDDEEFQITTKGSKAKGNIRITIERICYIYNPQANEDPSIDLASIQKHHDGLGHASLRWAWTILLFRNYTTSEK